MTRAASTRWLLAVALAVVVGLPLVGRWLRPRDTVRCALDGLKVEPLYQVNVVDHAGTSRAFCCVRCAERWLALRDGKPAAVYVTDEGSGQGIDASDAWFVWSTVPTNPITRNRVHVFRDRADAEEHARAFHGTLLSKDERPFRYERSSGGIP